VSAEERRGEEQGKVEERSEGREDRGEEEGGACMEDGRGGGLRKGEGEDRKEVGRRKEERRGGGWSHRTFASRWRLG